MKTTTNTGVTVIVTKPNGNIFLLRAIDAADAARYVAEVESRGWRGEVDFGDTEVSP